MGAPHQVQLATTQLIARGGWVQRKADQKQVVAALVDILSGGRVRECMDQWMGWQKTGRDNPCDVYFHFFFYFYFYILVRCRLTSRITAKKVVCRLKNYGASSGINEKHSHANDGLGGVAHGVNNDETIGGTNVGEKRRSPR
jgi:hypothetical protein